MLCLNWSIIVWIYPRDKVKILLNAHSLINDHTPIWMPKMIILSMSFGISGTSNKCLL